MILNSCFTSLAKVFTLILVVFLISFSCKVSKTGNDTASYWVGTWGTAPQLVETRNMPPEPGLSENSLRQVVRVSLGGTTIRLKFTNEFSTDPVTMKSVQIAASTGGHSIDVSTNKELKFNGNSEITMNPGEAVISDPITFDLAPRMDVAITIYYGQTSETVSGHPGSRTTSFLLPGNVTSNTDFSEAIEVERWYNINRIDVMSNHPAASVAILGNSITDGRGSVTDQQNRWPDILSERLLQNPATQHIGVLNMGIGGNAVLAGGLGPTGMSRYERDILNQPGVRWAIIFHGVNDIGSVSSAEAATKRTEDLIAAYKQMITLARQKNIKVYGGTIVPFKGNSYYNEFSEQSRVAVNDWIRNSGWFDAVIDFEKALSSPDDPASQVSTYQNDGLHPDAAGYKTMGELVDLNLFME